MHLKTDHGLFAILGDFVRTLNSGADGIPLGPSKQQFRLKFMYATADSPANAFLYGFKEAVGPALKFCRTCEISRQNISQGFNDQNYTTRTLDIHLRVVAVEMHSVKYQVSHVPYRFSHLLVQTYDEVVETLSVGSHTLNQNSVLEISNATDDIPEFCKLYGVLRKGDELYAMVDIYLEAVFVPEVCAYQVSGSEPAIITLPEEEEILIDFTERQTWQDLTLHDKPPVDISMESTETTQINSKGLQNDNSETPQNLLSENGCTPPKDQSNPVGPNHLCKNESFLFAMQEVSTNLKEILRDTTEVNQNRSTEETTSLEGLSSQQLPPLIMQASLASNFETSVDVHLESFNHLSTATFTESDVNVSALRQKYSKQDPNAVLQVVDSQ
ncbi:unnamed protein product, partial [Allacma fusca]